MAAIKSSQSRSRVGATRPAEAALPTAAPEPERDLRPPDFSHLPGKDAAAIAEYIATLTAELAAMAGGARLDMLTYFLNMARLEAEFHMRRD